MQPQVPPIVQQGVPITQLAHDATTHPASDAASPDPASPDELPLEELLEELPLDEPLEELLEEPPLEEPLDEPLEVPLDEPLEVPLDEPLEELPLDELLGVNAALKQAEWSLQASDRHAIRASMVTSL